jgi:mannosyltransferase
MRSSHWFALVALLLIAATLRAVNLTGESLWRDEIDIIRFALGPSQEILTSFTRTGFNGPFYIVLMRLWLLGGVNDFTLRYFSLLCGVALVAVVFVLAKRMFGVRAAFVAAWLMAISPVHIWYSGEGKMYTLQPLLLATALYALLREISQAKLGRDWRLEIGPHNLQSPISNLFISKTRWWILFVVATTLAFYTHVLSPIFLIVAAVVFLIHWPQAKAQLKGALVALACLTLPYLPLLLWQASTLFRGGDTGHAFFSLDRMALVLLSDWSYGFGTNAPLFFALQPSWVRMGCVVLFVIFAALGFIRSSLIAHRSALTALAWLILPVLAVFAISLRAPVFEPRYLLWCAPALYVLVGAGLGRLEIGDWRLVCLISNLQSLISVLVLTTISLLGLAAQITQPIRPDLRGGAAFIASQHQPSDLLVFQIPYNKFGFEYYFTRHSPLATRHFIEAPYTNYGMSRTEMAAELRRQLPPNRRVWLIETESGMWDARGLVRQWVDESLPLIERRSFNGVTLSLHQPERTLNYSTYLPWIQQSSPGTP